MSKRVFANNNTSYYTDYIPLKSGLVCLKTIKSNPYTENVTLNKFVSYNQFNILTNAYYLLADCNKKQHCLKDSIRNIYYSNDSYYEADNHDNNIDCNNKYIYPSGKINKNKNNIYQFPYKLDMSKWCNLNMNQCEKCIIQNPTMITYSNTNSCKTCKTGLCKNARNLFI